MVAVNSGAFFEQVVDSIYDDVYFVDPERRITFWNRAAEQMTGYDRSEVFGKCCQMNILEHVDAQGTLLCHSLCPLAATLKDGVPRSANVFLRHKHGHRVPVLVRVSPVRSADGGIVGAVETFNDESAHIAMIDRIKALEHDAFLDSLTELPNRRYLELELKNHHNQLLQHGWPYGVAMIDLDHFKNINDAYCHAIGDEALRLAARTISVSSRPSDLIGRWGGEEFLLIASRITAETLKTISNRLRALVARSRLNVNNQTITVTVSLGATLAHPDDRLETVIERADKLLYQSKEDGRNRVTVLQ